MDEASKYFGVDPAYYGVEGEEKVRGLLKSKGYTEEDLGEKNRSDKKEEVKMKHTIQNLTTDINIDRLKIDMGNDIGSLTIRGKIDSIAVEVGRDSSKICIIQDLLDQKEARVFNLKDYGIGEVSELLNDIIVIGKPKYLCLDGYGLGRAVKDSLYSKLLKKAIIVKKNGTIIYDLGEDYLRLLS